MKNRKKWVAALVCLCMTICLAACAPESNSTPETTTAAPNDQTTGKPKIDTVITTAQESYEVATTETVAINAKIVTSAPGISLSYASADENIATVSKYGKIKGVAEGTTEIIITSSDGVEKRVSVTVHKRVVEKILRLALNVMWNDTELGCFNNETGEVLTITEDGQYTLTFDCANLSEATKALGVTGLNNLTSIYIKDYDVTTAELIRSNVVACEIRWDKIVVDDVELTITDGEFKSAMKETGIFDTNDQFNAWDGSSVAEVTVDAENHVLNINMDNPQTVSVTFTISGITFAE